MISCHGMGLLPQSKKQCGHLSRHDPRSNLGDDIRASMEGAPNLFPMEDSMECQRHKN